MKKIFLFLPLLLLAYSCSKQQPVIDIPLKEHPRPDFERSAWQNLNGYWQFAPDSLMTGEKENWQDNPEKFASKILVPFSWASPMSGITLPKVNVGWYSREFTVERGKDWKGKNLYLIFGASDFRTKVWVNNKYAGEHQGRICPV